MASPVRSTARKPECLESISDGEGQLLVKTRVFDAVRNKWSAWQIAYRRPHQLPSGGDTTSSPTRCWEYTLPKGGKFCVYPNLLSKDQQDVIATELLMSSTDSFFREYVIQGNLEPRAHFLLHELATADFEGEAQPGYKYGQIRMKARPLSEMPHLKKLSKDMASLCRATNKEHDASEAFWNIGVNPVLYRDGRDKIGYHSDNDQGEQLILTALVSSPVGITTRRIQIRETHRAKTGGAPVDGEEEIEIFLDAGDAYSMDGEMQKRYVHGVPCDKKSEGDQKKRLAIVFRRGRQQYQTKDSGTPCDSLQPRIPVPYKFGQIDGIDEGCTYTRSQMLDLYAHRSQQRGISGNQNVGCDAIIVSKVSAKDRLFSFTYASTTQQGARAMLKSHQKNGTPIRVFRSSSLNNVFRALPPKEKGAAALYRYDGLYTVSSYQVMKGSNEVSCEASVKDRGATCSSQKESPPIYHFDLDRMETSVGEFANKVSNKDFLKSCLKLKTIDPKASRAIFGLRTNTVKKLSNTTELGLPVSHANSVCKDTGASQLSESAVDNLLKQRQSIKPHRHSSSTRTGKGEKALLLERRKESNSRTGKATPTPIKRSAPSTMKRRISSLSDDVAKDLYVSGKHIHFGVKRKRKKPATRIVPGCTFY